MDADKEGQDWHARAPVRTHTHTHTLARTVFTDADKEEEDWQAELTQDVRSEASKCGEVMHCFVDENSKVCVCVEGGSTLCGPRVPAWVVCPHECLRAVCVCPLISLSLMDCLPETTHARTHTHTLPPLRATWKSSS